MTSTLYLNIPFAKASISQKEIDAVIEVMQSGWLTTGPKVHTFEKLFSDFIKSKFSVALNSATAALHLSLEAIGLKSGEGVLLPTHTFAATAEVVRYFNAIPIFCDINIEDFNINIEDAESRYTAALQSGINVRAIIPVHYAGQMCDMSRIMKFAKKREIYVIEDAAHTCPAYYRENAESVWEPPGYRSDAACFSFYANKAITTGEGGIVSTNHQSMAERIRIMSLHGISKDAWKRFTAEGSWYYEIIAAGYKYNLTDIAAAIGICQLERMIEMHERRSQAAMRYIELLSDINEVSFLGCRPNRIHSWHLFVIRLLDNNKCSRNDLIERLKNRGIGTSVHWLPLHMHPYYRDMYGYNNNQFPIAESISNQIISLPIFSDIKIEDVELVVDSIKESLSIH